MCDFEQLIRSRINQYDDQPIMIESTNRKIDQQDDDDQPIMIDSTSMKMDHEDDDDDQPMSTIRQIDQYHGNQPTVNDSNRLAITL